MTSDVSDDSDFTVTGSVAYRAPIGASGLYGEIYLGSVTARRDASGAFVDTELEGANGVIALGIPFLRDVARYGYGLIELRYSDAESKSPGLTFQSKARAISFGVLYGETFQNGTVLEFGGNIDFGVRGASVSAFDDGDDSFWLMRAGIGVEGPVKAISENTSWHTEVWG